MGRLGELLVILAIVFMLFGTRRLKDFGSDLGAAIKGFKTNIGDNAVVEKGAVNDLVNGAAKSVAEPFAEKTVIADPQGALVDAVVHAHRDSAQGRM